MASFTRTSGTPVRMRLMKPALSSRASSRRAAPLPPAMPAARSAAAPRAVDQRIGITDRVHHARHARRDQRLDARRRAAVMAARLERHIRGGAAGLALPAARSAAASACASPARSCQPSPTIAPALHQHAADARIRVGGVQPARRQRQRAAMKARSSASKSAHLRRLRARRVRPAAAAADRGWPRHSCGRAHGGARGARRWRRRSISSRKASTSWKLRYTEAKRTYATSSRWRSSSITSSPMARDGTSRSPRLRSLWHDAAHRLVDRLARHRALLQRLGPCRRAACASSKGSRLRSLLTTTRHEQLGGLEGREALAAAQTLAAAADLAALAGQARVGDLGLDVAAEGTVHRCVPAAALTSPYTGKAPAQLDHLRPHALDRPPPRRRRPAHRRSSPRPARSPAP